MQGLLANHLEEKQKAPCSYRTRCFYMFFRGEKL